MKEKILTDLEPLFIRANKNRLWFQSGYQNILFSPKELREQHSKNSFVWGPVNWNLIDPKTHLRDPDKLKQEAIQYNEALLKRIEEGWEL